MKRLYPQARLTPNRDIRRGPEKGAPIIKPATDEHKFYFINETNELLHKKKHFKLVVQPSFRGW